MIVWTNRLKLFVHKNARRYTRLTAKTLSKTEEKYLFTYIHAFIY